MIFCNEFLPSMISKFFYKILLIGRCNYLHSADRPVVYIAQERTGLIMLTLEVLLLKIKLTYNITCKIIFYTYKGNEKIH